MLLQEIKESDWQKLNTKIDGLKRTHGSDIKTNVIIPPCVGFNGGHITVDNFKYTIDTLNKKDYSYTILEYPNVKDPENLERWYKNTQSTRLSLIREKKLYDIREWREENVAAREAAKKALDLYLNDTKHPERKEKLLQLEEEDANAFLSRGKNSILFKHDEAKAYVHEEVVDTLALHYPKNPPSDDKSKIFNVLFHSEKKLYKSILWIIENAEGMNYYSMPVCKFSYTEYKGNSAGMAGTRATANPVDRPAQVTVPNKTLQTSPVSELRTEDKDSVKNKEIELNLPPDCNDLITKLFLVMMQSGMDPLSIGAVLGSFAVTVTQITNDPKNIKISNIGNNSITFNFFSPPLQKKDKEEVIFQSPTPKPRGLAASNNA